MKFIKRSIILLITLSMICSLIACSKKAKKPSEKNETQPKLPEVVKELEKDILQVMNNADMIPYFERTLSEKKKIEEEKKAEELQMQAVKKNDSKEQENDTKKEDKEKEEKSQEKKPKPMTIDDTILTYVLKKEEVASKDSSEKPPSDLSEIWKKINLSIVDIHNKWNVLEPLLTKQGVSSDSISDFKDSLNTLTNNGIQNKHLDTIIEANLLTSYLSKFIPYFKSEIAPSIYILKYHTRHIVISASIDDYETALKNFNSIKEQSVSIKTKLIEKKVKSTAEKFEASVINLGKALEKKDIYLIKINASIVMKNLMLMTEDLASSIE